MCELSSEEFDEDAYVKNVNRRVQLRNGNLSRVPKEPEELITRNSQIKVINKFITKLRSEQKMPEETLLSEIKSLNLSKYIEEVTNALAKSVTSADIIFYTQVASQLNLDYENVPSIIYNDINKLISKAMESPDDTRETTKALFIFATELYVCGFTFAYKDLLEMLSKIFKSGSKKKSFAMNEDEKKLYAFFYNCDTMAAFLQNYGEIFTNIVAPFVKNVVDKRSDLEKYQQMLPTMDKGYLTNFYAKYVEESCNVLLNSIKIINSAVDELNENLQAKGEFFSDKERRYKELTEKYSHLMKYLRQIVCYMNLELPVELAEYSPPTLEGIIRKFFNKIETSEVFENVFEREIYQGLPNLVQTEEKSASESDYKKWRDKLQNCKNVADSEELAKEFESLNNKRNRKLLAQDLLEYRKEYNLVTPYLCRLAAIVNLQFKDISHVIVEQMTTEGDKLKELTAPSFINEDKKKRHLKYLCELTKFRIIEPDRVMNSIHKLIEDLSGNNIDLLLAALESVGRFLYVLPISSNKFITIITKLENTLKQKSFPILVYAQLTNSINLLKPYVEKPRPKQPDKSPLALEATVLVSIDIENDLTEPAYHVRKFIARSEAALQAFIVELYAVVEKYNTLGSYNYAYFLTCVNSNRLNQEIAKYGHKLLFNCLESPFSSQLSQHWARFYAELFKYNIVLLSGLFKTLYDLFEIPSVSHLNCACVILELCIEELMGVPKLDQLNEVFITLVDFKKYVSKMKYVPMLTEFHILEVFELYEPEFISTDLDTFEKYLSTSSRKKDLFKGLLTFLKKDEKRNEKREMKAIQEKLLKDRRKIPENAKVTLEEQPTDKSSDFIRNKSKNTENINNTDKIGLQKTASEQTNTTISTISPASIVQENLLFEQEFRQTVSNNHKDYANRLTRETYPEKTIEKRQEKRKIKEGEKVFTVVGRVGVKFLRKDVVLPEEQRQSLT